MAQKGNKLDQEPVSCSICVDLLKDPVTIPCGHSYCMSCVKTHWDGEDQRRIYSCPQCSQTFRPRPVLVRRQQIQQRIQERQKDVELLQQEVEDINVSADKTVEDSEEIFAQLIRLMQERSSDVKQQVRSQQETEVRRVKELQEKLEQEITELTRKDAELEQLSHTEDHKQFLHNYPSVSALSGSPHSSSIRVRPRRHFEDVTAAVSELRDVLQDVLRDRGTNVSLRGTAVGGLLPEPEPKTRADFLEYSREITLDPNSAHRRLLLSDGNRKATLMEEDQINSDHPDRFSYYDQVLSRESLTGRCYWEVEIRAGEEVRIVVSYQNIRRDGHSDECRFGFNDKSWALDCFTHDLHSFWHNKLETPILGVLTFKIGVYLDHGAGILCFYSISETMTLLHRVQTTFTQPLHAGVRFYGFGDSAEFIRLK
nr:E3 ubiquitin/ISG15 ligase TRIM25 [Nothobranchius furzeri]